MRIELISEDIYSFAEVISEYETSVLTVKLRGRTLIGWVSSRFAQLYSLNKISSKLSRRHLLITNITLHNSGDS